MASVKHVLVPFDGSDVSRWVLEKAQRVLRLPGRSVTFLGVDEMPEMMAEDLNVRQDVRKSPLSRDLERAKGSLSEYPVLAFAKIRYGDPAREILREIAEGSYDLVVMGTHGRGGLDRVLFGSVAEKVLRASPIPMLLYRPEQLFDETLSPEESREPSPMRRILMPLDGSLNSEDIVPATEALARPLSAKVCLLSVIPPEEVSPRRWGDADLQLSNVQRALGGHDLVSLKEVSAGNAPERILAFIRTHHIDVLAMTTHGRSGLDRLLHGSVFEILMRHAGIPILVIRNPNLRAPMPAPASAYRYARVE